MIPLLENIQLAQPQICMLLTACVVLVSSMFAFKHESLSIWVLALLGVVLSAFLSIAQLEVGATVILSGQFICDSMSQIMNVGICLTVFLILIYSRAYVHEHQMPGADILALSLFATFGMMVLVCANTLLTSYLGLELTSLPLYALTAVRRANGDSSEAAMKYFVMGAIASGMLLYGFSLLYGITGHLELSQISSALTLRGSESQLLLSVSLIFILAGVSFKLALVPFHMWAPDVYQGAPLSVTLLLSTAPKIAGLALAIRLLTMALGSVAVEWQSMLLVMTLLSILLGNLFAVVQTNIRRLLAYSAIAHMGFAFFGVMVANSTGYSSALYYLLIYALMTTAAFGLLVLLSHSGIEIENIDDLKGLNQQNPWAAAMFMIVMFSMAGIPPTAGFFIKLAVLKSLIDVHLIWVAIVAVILAVIGAYYYLRIVKVMYFDNPESINKLTLSGGAVTKVLYSLNCLTLLYFGIFPSALISLCSNVFMS